MAITFTKPLADLKACAISRVNEKAGIIITDRIPLWKQNNYNARANQMNHKAIGLYTQADQDEWNAMEALWTWVQSVRDASNTATAAINAATTGQQIYTAEQTFYNQTF